MAVLALIPACATIVEGTSQNLNVSTNYRAECTLTDKKGQVYQLVSPGSVKVKRGDGPIKAVCTAYGRTGEKMIDETLEPWALANIFVGVVGLGVDAISGSYQKYPDEITISIVQ